MMEENTQRPPPEEPELNEEASLTISRKLKEQNPLIQTVSRLLIEGIEQRSSDILIEPLDSEVQIRYRIDGLLYKHLVLSKTFQESIVSRIKVLAGLDISEHRLPQDGRFKMNYRDSEIDFRVSVVPSISGEKVVLRVLDKTKITLDIDKLGLDQRTVELFKRNLVKPFGMILVCGPTGSGKTTTLYSALKYIDSLEKNIITVENPVEYQLFGINQVEVLEDIGYTFVSALRAILRQDPDIILVGEIRDFETADIAVKAALTGHLLLSTLHTTSASGSIIRLANMGVEPFLIASSCLLIVSQVLVRTLCPQCKEGYHPLKAVVEQFRALNVPISEETFLYRKRGCPACNNSGFKGRLALAESLELNSRLRELITLSASEKEIRAAAVKDGMVGLQENGLALVRAGLTSIEEVLRISSL